ncbi:HDR156Cp [Eremothecium sinecaudum]|uniref:Endonuclease n=1 Tax=Eremothecium sinecaudum TaxID=45286 RepID=A0A109UZJ3_9SACH|nr:HDR156Cp [Eremothecium sinecaudum]AMD20898.1 HDR156Cp [Eremothecium sinecaudum]
MSLRRVIGGVVGTGAVGLYLFKRKSEISNNAPLSISSDGVTTLTDTSKLIGNKPAIDPAGFFKYGFPGPIHDLQTHEGFISCYDRRMRNPYWVVEHITAESLAANNAARKKSFFKEDDKIPDMFKARLRDYFRSGYDRGHLVPAADAKYSQTAMDETFYLTNMCPQVGDGFNRDYWARLEQYCRRMANKYKSVRIVTGPLYLPKKCPDGKYRVTYEMIGNPPNIAVPTHFFKLLVAEGDSVYVSAFVLPNEPIPDSTKLSEFQVPVNALERATGLQFLHKTSYKTLPVDESVMNAIAIEQMQYKKLA